MQIIFAPAGVLDTASGNNQVFPRGTGVVVANAPFPIRPDGAGVTRAGVVLAPMDYRFLMVLSGFVMVLGRFVRIPGSFVFGVGFALQMLGCRLNPRCR